MYSTTHYQKLLREQLKLVNVKVKRWVDWDPDSDIYEAFFEERTVIIPKPIDDWSFLVGLHEIGHISTGDRVYSYLCEYNAEIWALRRAKESYGITCPEYEQDARNYVKKHLIENLIFRHLKVEKVSLKVMDWLGVTKEDLIIEVTALLVHGNVVPHNYPVNYNYWFNAFKKVA